MLYEFHQGKNATQVAIAISFIHGEIVVSVRTCQKWFARFRERYFDLEDEQRPGRSQELETDRLQALLDEDPRQSTLKLAAQLNVVHSTVLRRLHDMGKINKVGKWVPHKLSQININQRLSTCISLLARYKKRTLYGKLLLMKNGFIIIIL
jgi:transposase